MSGVGCPWNIALRAALRATARRVLSAPGSWRRGGARIHAGFRAAGEGPKFNVVWSWTETEASGRFQDAS